MEEITIKLPLELIKQILRHVPAKELEKLRKGPRKKEIKSMPADYLLELAGIVAIGGNAMEDTERVWQ
jgi:hypothetical protein